MIKLDLLEPCEHCPDLEPIKKNEFGVMCDNKMEYHCTITCQDIDKCKVLLAYLTKEVKKNG